MKSKAAPVQKVAFVAASRPDKELSGGGADPLGMNTSGAEPRPQAPTAAPTAPTAGPPHPLGMNTSAGNECAAPTAPTAAAEPHLRPPSPPPGYPGASHLLQLPPPPPQRRIQLEVFPSQPPTVAAFAAPGPSPQGTAGDILVRCVRHDQMRPLRNCISLSFVGGRMTHRCIAKKACKVL